MTWYKNVRNLDKSQRLSILFGFLIVIGLLIVALGVLSTIKITPYATYKNKKYGFEIKFPAYWKSVRHPPGGSVILFTSPKQDGLDQFQENVNVSIRDMPQAMTLEHFSSLVVNQVAGTFGEQINITQSVEIFLGGRTGYRLTFEGYGPKVENPIMYVAAWTIVGNRAFIITYTGMKKEYPLYQKKVDTMINSFKLFPPDVH